ncbi:phytanoyl-CoA dioxygenase family protein [Paraburkholderia sp. RL18-085-BIA-A]|uniref:phytanoyl-CoA dioxygenase family protein n=1 Tax=Paraburkholderia sp. RL18-085-BIA-A TaxID=3031633 RepID=UPI0038BA7BE7
MISNRNFIDLEFGRDNGVREKAFSPSLLHVLDIVNQGYTVVRGTSAVPARCDAARAAVARFKEANAEACARHVNPHGYLPPLSNLHCGLPELFNLFSTHTLVAEIADHFLGEAVVVSSSYTEQGSTRTAERDAPKFCTEPEHLHMDVWFALEDMDGQNGPLTLVPKAHALPELDRAAILRSVYHGGGDIDPESPELWNAYQAELRKQYEQAGLAEENILVRKGDVVIRHPDMPHGEARASDPQRTRHALVMRVTPPDMQIGSQDVFYGARKLPAEPASWRYKTAGARRYVDHHAVGFGQQAIYLISDLSF